MIHSLTHLYSFSLAHVYAELEGGWVGGWLIDCGASFLFFLFFFFFLLLLSLVSVPPPQVGQVGEVGSKLLRFEDGLQSIRTGYEVAGCVCVYLQDWV